MICKIHHIGILVRDFDTMVGFYKQAFGFEVVGKELEIPAREGRIPRVIMMRSGNCFLEIIQDPNAGTSGAYAHISIEVGDIETEYARLGALRMTFDHPKPGDYGHVKSGYGRDPEGNRIELQQTIQPWECNLDKL